MSRAVESTDGISPASTPAWPAAERPATEQQKDRIAELAELGGEPIDRSGWTDSFSERDAAEMIDGLESALAERAEAEQAVERADRVIRS